MDEYEVDLIDYLRVMWKGKWIILGVFVAAVAVALIISLRTPNQYEAQAVVRLNPLPGIAGVELEAR
ncbi:MAG: Wzz/FepE/Etk N-terminal domain-containing protein, partial [Candidatus Bipolaricaulota bacterium]|nr:Wzz/FepE/Etk N-terminal domain-containing protein [Candidatus Bipolaricaulota bacterium]